ELSRGAQTGERPLSSEPATLARAATRAELRRPGSLERVISVPSSGRLVGASLLGTVAGYVVGSALVSAFLPWDAGHDAAPAGDGLEDADGADAGVAAAGFDGGFAVF